MSNSDRVAFVLVGTRRGADRRPGGQICDPFTRAGKTMTTQNDVRARARRMELRHRDSAHTLRVNDQHHAAALVARDADLMRLMQARISSQARPIEWAREQSIALRSLGELLDSHAHPIEGSYATLTAEQFDLLADELVTCGDIGKPVRHTEHEPIEEPMTSPVEAPALPEPVPA